MKKKSVVVLLTVTMVIEMTAAGCGDKQLAPATDRVVSLELIQQWLLIRIRQSPLKWT